jgi:DivIVA domain-containing protein
VELERHHIERRDFAQARRGYDPEEVDGHLAEIAVAVEELRASRYGSAKPASLAGAAAEQVRTIVEAAERSAAEIESSARAEAEGLTAEAKREAERERTSARTEAEQVRGEAASDARQTRERAESDAREHLARVQEATSGMMSRADTVESDLNGLVDQIRTTIDSLLESVRTNAGSLEAELVEIQSGLAVVRESAPQPQEEELEPAESSFAAQGEPIGADETIAEEPLTEAESGAPEAYDEGTIEEYAEEDLAAEPAELEVVDEEPLAEEERPAGGDGAEGARLIALNMALNGTPRDETARYLEENFDLEDQEAILDEVYARVGG